MGYPTVKVYSQPKVALLVTGDELVPPGDPLIKGKIFKSNLFLIAGTPVIFSTYQNKPILNLSGNPFAALTIFELIARPMLGKVRLPEGGYSSGMVASMKDCNCLVEIEQGKKGNEEGNTIKILVL